MIPKTIHYCWFGPNQKPELLLQCINSWKEHCPDYQIIEWNESNFDINLCDFTRQAYEQKKYAFVSDVARLWVVYHYGGHYLDTDVELKQSLDVFSEYRGWMAADSIWVINTGLGFGSEKGAPHIKCMLDYYYTVPYQEQICVNVNTKELKAYNPTLNIFNTTRVVDGHLFIAYTDYGKYATHYYTATWKDGDVNKRIENIANNKNKRSLWKELRWKLIVAVRRPKLVRYIQTHNNLLCKILHALVFDLVDCGFIFCIKAAFRKLFRRKK